MAEQRALELEFRDSELSWAAVAAMALQPVGWGPVPLPSCSHQFHPPDSRAAVHSRPPFQSFPTIPRSVSPLLAGVLLEGSPPASPLQGPAGGVWSWAAAETVVPRTSPGSVQLVAV